MQLLLGVFIPTALRLRDMLHCHVTIEGNETTIRPAHRCPPLVLAAALAVVSKLRAMLQIEADASPLPWEPADTDVKALAVSMAATPAYRIADLGKVRWYFEAEARRRLTAAMQREGRS